MGSYSDPYSNKYVEESPFTCRHCLYACENVDDMVDHYTIHELLRVCYPQTIEPLPPFSWQTCPYCLKPFENMDALMDHIDLVYSREYTCVLCHEFLTSAIDYLSHLQQHKTACFKICNDRQIDVLYSNSTEEEGNAKSPLNRRRKRSKKALGNRNSKIPLVHQARHHSLNTRQVDETSILNVTKNSSIDWRTTINDINETNMEPESDLERHRFNVSLTSPQLFQSPINQEVCNNVPSNEESTKQGSRHASENTKGTEEHRSIASPSNLQTFASSNDRKVVTKKLDIKKKKSVRKGEFQRNLQEHTFAGSKFSEIDLQGKVSYEQDIIKNIKMSSMESEGNVETFVSLAGTASQQTAHSPNISQIAPINVFLDQKNINEEESKEAGNKVQESSFNPQSVSSVYPEGKTRENNKISNESEKDFGSIISLTDSQMPQTILSAKQIASTNVSYTQENITREESEESDKSESEATIYIPQIGSSFDQTNRGDKKSERNKQEFMPVTASPSISLTDQEDCNKKQGCERNLETLAYSKSLESVNTEIIDSNASYQEGVIKEERKESENSIPESVAAIASSSAPRVIDLPNGQRVIFTYASVDSETDITKDEIEENREMQSYLEDKSVASPPDPRLSAIRRPGGYDADVSTGTSSDDQEVAQIGVYGAYVRRSKELGQSSVFTGKISYNCTKCYIPFESANNFVAHNLMHSIFWCLKCEIQFSLKSAFLEHLLEHVGNKPFACFRCWKNFSTNNEFRMHMAHCPLKESKRRSRRN